MSFAAGAVKWVNTWEGAERSSRDWDRLVLLRELKRGRDRLEAQKPSVSATGNRHRCLLLAWLTLYYNFQPFDFCWKSGLSGTSNPIQSLSKHYFTSRQTNYLTLNWFYRLHVDQFQLIFPAAGRRNSGIIFVMVFLWEFSTEQHFGIYFPSPWLHLDSTIKDNPASLVHTVQAFQVISSTRRRSFPPVTSTERHSPGLSTSTMQTPGPEHDDSFDFLFKIILIGDSNVGKTCVVQNFKSGVFSEKQQNTIGVDFSVRTVDIEGKKVKVSRLLCMVCRCVCSGACGVF